jgi:transposase
MLSFPSNVRLYMANKPVDFRKSFDGLAAVVSSQFLLDPMAGHVFIFLNKRASQVRILFWDRDGFCLVSKRLETGTFRRAEAANSGDTHLEIASADLSMLLAGIDLNKCTRRPRYISKKIAPP